MVWYGCCLLDLSAFERFDAVGARLVFFYVLAGSALGSQALTGHGAQSGHRPALQM
jgi:hypothetical protein